MNTTEIKELVTKSLAGQRSAVDLGNALPRIVESLCDLIDEDEQKLAVYNGLVVDISNLVFDEENKVLLTEEQSRALIECGFLLNVGGVGDGFIPKCGTLPKGATDALLISAGGFLDNLSYFFGMISYNTTNYEIINASGYVLGYDNGEPYLVMIEI